MKSQFANGTFDCLFYPPKTLYDIRYYAIPRKDFFVCGEKTISKGKLYQITSLCANSMIVRGFDPSKDLPFYFGETDTSDWDLFDLKDDTTNLVVRITEDNFAQMCVLFKILISRWEYYSISTYHPHHFINSEKPSYPRLSPFRSIKVKLVDRNIHFEHGTGHYTIPLNTIVYINVRDKKIMWSTFAIKYYGAKQVAYSSVESFCLQKLSREEHEAILFDYVKESMPSKSGDIVSVTQ